MMIMDMNGDELAEVLCGVVLPLNEANCNQNDCDEEAMIGIGPDTFCDHHARDLALQLDPNDFVGNGVGEGSLL